MTPVDTAVSLPRLTLVELRKLVDTRAGSWLLATIGLLTAAIVTIDLIWGDRANLTLGNLLADAVLVPSLLLPVLGILLITSEWSQRTHLVTFTLVPNRGRVAVAKIAAGVLAGVSAIVVCLALAAVGTLIGDWTGDIAGWSLRWSHVGNATLVLALSMLMGIAFGMVLLNSPLAIVVYFVLPTVWSVLGAMIPSLNRVAEWLDTAVTMPALFAPSVPAEAWARLGVSVAVWIGLPLAVGLVRVIRREVS
jgi:ABC-type transport system involved in multi-copper enzyme maturation permease subunit